MPGSKTKLTGAQRQLVVGVAAIMACAVIASATYNFIIDPLTTDLNATEMIKLRCYGNFLASERC